MNQPQGPLSRRLAVLRRPPLVCAHDWLGTAGSDVFICQTCGACWRYEGNETPEEPPFVGAIERQNQGTLSH